MIANTMKALYAGFAKFVGLNALHKVSPHHVVFITGSDSGLGFNLALVCHSLNMTVVAGCHNINSKGCKLLQNVPDSERMIPIEIDVTKSENISKALELITKLTSDQRCEFWALVNNAGVMCFGEFEWQTPKIIENQINVNLLGPMRVTHEFLPLIRKHRGRIINVTSHCALQALPALSPYTASKSGLRFWSEALRMELKNYGVKVVNFIPGSFVGASNIASHQMNSAETMWAALDGEQKTFYGDYFKEFNNYLSVISGTKEPIVMEDDKLFDLFKNALLNPKPKTMYLHEPWRYTIYRWLFKVPIVSLRDYFVMKFISLPVYKCKNKLEIKD